MIIGERTGLTVSDSVGLDFTSDPRPGRQDCERNGISNVHPNGGLSAALAARKLGWLVGEALRRPVSGVSLKDDMPAAIGSQNEPPGRVRAQGALQRQ